LYQGEDLTPYHKNSVTKENQKIYNEGKYIFGALLVIKKDCFDKLNGFDESFGVGSKYGGGEDADFLFRMNKKGLITLRDPRVYCFHKSFIEEYSFFEGYKKGYNNGFGSGALLAKHLFIENNFSATFKIIYEFALSFFAIFYYLAKLNLRMAMHHLISQLGKFFGSFIFIINIFYKILK